MSNGQQYREGAFKIFVAAPNSGKTTDIKHYINANRRNLIVPSGKHDTAWHGPAELQYRVEMVDNEWKPGTKRYKPIIEELHTFTGTRLLHVAGKPQLFDAIADPEDGLVNSRLVLDDFRNYIYSKGELKQDVGIMFRNRRQRMLDIFMACHDPGDISRDLLALNPTIIVGFTTTLPTDTSIERVPYGASLLDTIKRVNAENMSRPEKERWYKEQVPFA